MASSSLPQEPQKRRAILVVSDSNLRDLQYEAHRDKTAQDLLYHNQVSLLNVDTLTSDSIESDSLIKELSKSGDLLNSGNLLVQSPYNSDEYVEASKAYYTFARKKWDVFTYFWGYLGAKEASVKLNEIKITDTTMKGSAKGNTTFSGSAEAERRALEKIKKEMNLKKKYRDAQGKIMPDKAKDYIRKYQWMFRDQDFEGAIELCEEGILLEEQEFSMTITQESQTNLNLALSLNVPTSLALNVKFEQVKKEFFNFSIETKVTFW